MNDLQKILYALSDFQREQDSFQRLVNRIFDLVDAGRFVLQSKGQIHETPILNLAQNARIELLNVAEDREESYRKLSNCLSLSEINQYISPLSTAFYIKTVNAYIDEISSMYAGEHAIQKISKKKWW